MTLHIRSCASYARRHLMQGASTSALGLTAVLAIVLVAGCGGGPSSSGDPAESAFATSAPQLPGGSGSAKITYRPEVRIVEQRDGWNALIGVSFDGSTLVFDRSGGAVPALAPGDVLLIKGLYAKRILAVETSGDELAVLTFPAGLTDIVADGTIRLQAPIRFGAPGRVASADPTAPWESFADLLLPPASAQAPDAERRKSFEQGAIQDQNKNLAKAAFKSVIDGWEAQYSVTPEPGRLNLHLQLKRSIASAVVVVTGDGYLADFDFAADIDVERSVVERMELAYKKLNGVMNFTWEAQTTTGGMSGKHATIKLPGAIEIPLAQYLGGLPLFLEISAAVIAKPALGAAREFSRGAFRITYDGYQTFRIKEGVVDSDGNVSGDIELYEAANGSYAPSGMVVAFAAPRIELSMGVSKLFKFADAKEAAEKADQYLELLISKTFGDGALAQLRESPLSKVTAGGIVKTAMGSDAAAWLQLTTTSGMSHTGGSVLAPCTRTDLSLSVRVGSNAHAFGESVGNSDAELYTKALTNIQPKDSSLCLNL